MSHRHQPAPRGTIQALQTALSAEHVAIYGYSLVGARLGGGSAARRLWDAHRARRDKLRSELVRHGATPVAAEAAYRLPAKATAGKLAAALEDGVAAGYLALAAADDPVLRRYAALAMQEAVTRAIEWRGSGPPAFPGMATRSTPTPTPTP